MEKLKSLMQLMVYTYYWMLFFKNDNLKYSATSKRKPFNSFPLFCVILFFVVFFYYLFTNSHAQRKIASMIYIAYHILRVMLHILPEICIGECFLEDYFYWHCQQVISAVAKVFNTVYWIFNNVRLNTTPRQIKQM